MQAQRKESGKGQLPKEMYLLEKKSFVKAKSFGCSIADEKRKKEMISFFWKQKKWYPFQEIFTRCARCMHHGQKLLY